jgi:hypothetical protein
MSAMNNINSFLSKKIGMQCFLAIFSCLSASIFAADVANTASVVKSTALAGKSTALAVKSIVASDLTAARNLPANNKILFFLGQDSETLTDYRVDVLDKDATVPRLGGITLYTSIVSANKKDNLINLTKNLDHGAGIINFSRSLREFPDAALAVGLYLSDAATGCKSEPTRAIAGILGNGISKDHVSSYRADVDKLITFLKDTHRPVFLRIGYEFDGPWNCYSPDSYKLAFRYIKQRIDELKADKVATVWQSAAWPRNQAIYQVTDANHLDKFYPGDDLVDWVSLSVFYGKNYQQHQWACDQLNPDSFTPHVTPLSQQERILNFARSHKKPVMIAEAAPVGFDNTQLTTSCIFTNRPSPITAEAIWESWYADWFAFIEDNKDVVRGVHYINTNWRSQSMWRCTAKSLAGSKNCNQGYWGDSRVQANPIILQKFKQAINRNSYVNGREP